MPLGNTADIVIVKMLSVCLASHNGEHYIKEQIDSILVQLGPNDEIIVSDDGSEDETIRLLMSYDDPRIRVYEFHHSTRAKRPHECVCENFYNAIIHARGDYIFLSDQDDEWMPNKVEVCLRDLETYDLVLHDFVDVDEKGNVIKPLHYDGRFRTNNYLMCNEMHFGCAMAFKRCVLDYALPLPNHLLLHDYWIGILVESLGNFIFEKTPLIKHRIHGKNTSNSRNPLWFKIYYRFRTFMRVLRRVISVKTGRHHSMTYYGEK